MHSSRLDCDNVETKSCRYGMISYLKSDLLIGRSLREYGEWAQAEIDFLGSLLDKGNVAVDVRAYIGTHTLAFAQFVGDKGKVYSFEPQATAFELLKQNVIQNKLPNISTFNIALADSTGVAYVGKTNQEIANNPGLFSLGPMVSEDSSSDMTVKVTTLDHYHLDKCDLIKIDVEGMELSVLKGAADTLLRFHPMVFAECISLHNGWQIVIWMKEMGYHAFLHNELCYNPDNFRRNSYNFLGEAREANIIFVPEDRVSAFEKDCRQFERLIPIPTLDDLALGLLRKPQYKYEVLANTEACQLVGIDFVGADEVNRLENELNQQRMQLENYIRAINASWSWRITRPLRFIALLKHEVTIRRVALALKYLGRGEIRFVLEGIRAIAKNRQERLKEEPSDDIALDHALTFFRHDAEDAPPLNQEVDIIICIYNGMPYLTRLFDSLLHNTDSPYRLILVDDASTDPDIQPFLQNIVQQVPNSVLICNPENMGHVKSINKAAQHARNHFALLNIDIEVPKGWLQRLMRPVIENANVASATPFTNAGTVCSFPHMNVDNDPFDNLTVGEIDAFFKLVNPEAVSIELPSGVGFCMGMSLNVWQKIGPFNESVFGRGYGEENDWSMRARAAGYRNVMVPNLFVYHKGSAIFGQKTKERQQRQNLPKVVELHPSYLKKVDDFIRRDPARPIRQFLTLLLSTRQAPAGTTLVIDHQLGGGANTYRQELIRNRLGKGEAILLLTYDTDYRFFRMRCLYKEYNVNFKISSFSDVLLLLKRVPCKEIFFNNLVTFPQPLDILHRIYDLKKNSKVNLSIALHDYFPICPSYTLLNSSGTYCDLPSLQICQDCLPGNAYAHGTDNDIERWRRTWGDVLEVADTVLCFSESSRRLLTRTYPLRPEQIIVTPHQLSVHFNRKPKIDFNSPMNIGVFGTIGYQKGVEIVVEMARILKDRAPEAKITVVGTLGEASRPKNLRVTGPYRTSELPDLIEKYRINICLFPSIWPETFSYVCSELMELGMPLCCFGLGAQGERVSKYRLGYVISRISPEAAAEEIIQFFASLKSRDELLPMESVKLS